MIKKNQVTINDVAKAAGVSPSTVSRVITDNPRISSATKDKVLKQMKILGYHPNAIARSLAKNKTGNIGIIMPSRSEDVFLNPFFPEALRGITRSAANNGYDLLLSTNLGLEDEVKSIKNLINSSKVDGIVLMSSKIDDESINYLSSNDFPFVLIGSPYDKKSGINHVDNDNFMAAYELTNYLTSMDKKNIAMIAGDPSLMVTRDRIRGYKKSIEDSKLEFNKNNLFIGGFEEETGYKYARKLLELDKRPDALVVTDDLVAFGAIQIFESQNIKIPKDIAIVSFNNSILSRYSQKPFTSVDVNAFDLGLESINIVVKAIEKGLKNQKKIIPYKIHKR